MRNTMRILTAAVSAVVITGLFAPASQARPTWDTSPVVVTKLVKPQPKVVDARVGAHPNFDRVVIDLDGKVPGYTVRYVKGLFYDGSGEPVPVHGRRFISIVLTPAKAHNADGSPTYEGPDIGHYELDVIRDVAFTGDFEGQVSFGISLRRKENFRVLVLHNPNRIVIDVHH
jgi:hypothetical protein